MQVEVPPLACAPNTQLATSGGQSNATINAVQEKCSNEPAKVTSINPKFFKAKSELEKLLQSQHADTGARASFAAKRYLLLHDSFSEMDEKPQQRLNFEQMADLISQECFEKVRSLI